MRGRTGRQKSDLEKVQMPGGLEYPLGICVKETLYSKKVLDNTAHLW